MSNWTRKKPPQSRPPLLRVRVETSNADRQEFCFGEPFRIGRDENCQVRINDKFVSRNHAEVVLEDGQWWVRDLHSTNGIYIDGQKVDRAPVMKPTTLRLGIQGPVLYLAAEERPPEEKKRVESDTMVSRYIEHYFGESTGQTVGEHTMMIRRAFERVQTKQRWKYGRIIGVLALLSLAVGAYALYQHRQARKQRLLAEDIFYSMKSLELEIADLERAVMESHSAQGMQEVKKYRSKRKDMETNYDKFISTLGVYNPKMPEPDRLILRVARIFGECELSMPAGFVAEVQSYIRKWQSSDRLKKAIQSAKSKGYAVRISQEMLAQDLPPQFFYLGLQESDFDPYTCGPMTRKGIAKGIWQFIPETAVKYGLRLGPLLELRRPDPGDERHNFEKSTAAAARYLKYIYSTDAQASGLLVMASYNWGEHKVIDLIRSMPANPRERNFWRLLSAHRDQIPQETYDYVFYIVSATAIGENPRLFGFDFDNPLSYLEKK